ncbi:hypothetical protein ABT160_43815 [Streptomyces sp. NPDC001941]|uniref:hypothetical protein n=1 Tax=Streptomyces sp. NPDC001941 TaxID=3154659 RepID=UPI0033239C96
MGVFEEEAAAEYDAPPDGYRREEAVRAALAWAHAAGLDADPPAVEVAFADGWYDDLTAAMGLRFTER